MRSYHDVAQRLRISYDSGAEERDRREKAEWKIQERSAFLERLVSEGKQNLLEVGAGTGQDAAFFREAGLHVVATDLSQEMVNRCREKGLEAYQADFLNLPFEERFFDSLYAMNCLLHVPTADLPEVLGVLGRTLKPGGLFFLGCYGGEGFEGDAPDDCHTPPRFFSFRTDDQMLELVNPAFDLVDLHVVDPGRLHFQSFTLRKENAASL